MGFRYANYLNKIPSADEIASAVLYFASDSAGYVTGADLIVDGGRSLALKGSDEGRSYSELVDYDFGIQCFGKIERIICDAHDRDIYIYGAGHGGGILARQLIEYGIEIAGFYDNQTKEQNLYKWIPVKLPYEAKGQQDKQYIVISLMNHNYDKAKEIAKSLRSMGYSESDMMIIAEN